MKCKMLLLSEKLHPINFTQSIMTLTSMVLNIHMKEEQFLKTKCNIDRPFTLLGYTVLTGDPVLYLIIIEGV